MHRLLFTFLSLWCGLTCAPGIALTLKSSHAMFVRPVSLCGWVGPFLQIVASTWLLVFTGLGCNGASTQAKKGCPPHHHQVHPFIPQVPPPVLPKQPRPRRKRKCSDREGLFIEVLNYTRRHKGCGLCSAKLPRLEECMCVNDSKHQFLVNLGRDVWGGDRCQLCVRKGYLALPTEPGIT